MKRCREGRHGTKILLEASESGALESRQIDELTVTDIARREPEVRTLSGQFVSFRGTMAAAKAMDKESAGLTAKNLAMHSGV